MKLKRSVSISVYTKKWGGEKIKTVLWDKYPHETIVKYMWYFRYRAALLQIKHPKCYIQLNQWDDDDPLEVARIKKFNEITTCKRMITKYTNAIEKYKQNQKMILLPYMDNPKYIKALETLTNYKIKLKELEHSNNEPIHRP